MELRKDGLTKVARCFRLLSCLVNSLPQLLRHPADEVEPRPHDPEHPFTNLLKRKLSSLHPGPSDASEKKPRSNVMSNRQSLAPEDKELLDGLRRFKDSDLGKEVKDICVNQ
jgi:hypothetical protein